MGKKILIVDDDDVLVEELVEFLKDNGFWVENTSDSSQGEKLINEREYDIYLFDYKMPGLHGIDLFKRVKTKNPKAVVFIVSGRPNIEKLLKEENVNNLVAGVIKKPFDEEVLLQKIRAYL
jgi:two-component system OmpR family response regulator